MPVWQRQKRQLRLAEWQEIEEKSEKTAVSNWPTQRQIAGALGPNINDLTNATQDDTYEETGWKLLHGDVMRPPNYCANLVALIGNYSLFGSLGCRLYLFTVDSLAVRFLLSYF